MNVLKSVDYETRGVDYSRVRQPDPRIAAPIRQALGLAATLVNVGAGAGSYEPEGLWVLPIEPAREMRRQRPPHLAPAIDGTAEALPLDDDAVDAALAVLSLHHWRDQERGLREMRRVARGPVVVLTFDPVVKSQFWLLRDYLPETAAHDKEIFPPPSEIRDLLGGGDVIPIAIRADCADGFFEAFFARPEAYLDPAVRRAQSAWGRLAPGVEERVVRELGRDLESGAWDARHASLRKLPHVDGGLRLVVSRGEQG